MRHKDDVKAGLFVFMMTGILYVSSYMLFTMDAPLILRLGFGFAFLVMAVQFTRLIPSYVKMMRIGYDAYRKEKERESA